MFDLLTDVPNKPAGSSDSENTPEITEHDSMAILTKGDLWNTLFRSGRSTKTFTRSLSGMYVSNGL